MRAWVQATQAKAWETLTKNHGAQAAETLLARLRDQLDQRGTLDVLRQGNQSPNYPVCCGTHPR